MTANRYETSPTVEGSFGALDSFFEPRSRLRARRFDDAHPLSEIFRAVLCPDSYTVQFALGR